MKVYFYNRITKASQWTQPPGYGDDDIKVDESKTSASSPQINSPSSSSKEKTRLQLFQEIYLQNCERNGIVPILSLKNEIELHLKNNSRFTMLVTNHLFCSEKKKLIKVFFFLRMYQTN